MAIWNYGPPMLYWPNWYELLDYSKFRFPAEHKTEFLGELLKLTNFVEPPQ